MIRQCNPNQDYFQRGVNYFDKGKSEKGFKYLDKAIKKDNQHMDALMRRGIEYMNVKSIKMLNMTSLRLFLLIQIIGSLITVGVDLI